MSVCPVVQGSGSSSWLDLEIPLDSQVKTASEYPVWVVYLLVIQIHTGKKPLSLIYYLPPPSQHHKSTTAAGAALSINPAVQVHAQQYKVGPDTTATVYHDAFFRAQDIVVNALVRPHARVWGPLDEWRRMHMDTHTHIPHKGCLETDYNSVNIRLARPLNRPR